MPHKIKINAYPKALILNVKSFWWYLPFLSGLSKPTNLRAMAMGNVVLLGPHILDKDLEHELVHVEQSEREPFIHPFLYIYNNLKYGYRDNKYEKEAYSRSGNIYTL